MKTKFLLLLFSLLFFLGCGYEYQERKYNRQSSCTRNNNFTVEERNQLSPFAETSKIAIVSFKNRKIDESNYLDLMKYFKQLNSDYSNFSMDDFDEALIINDEQKNQLTNLIYNYGEKKETEYYYTKMCYFPHNAILFLNDDLTLNGFIEICFDCESYRSSNYDIYNLGDFCRNKVNSLKDIFLTSGIQFVGYREY